MAISLVTCSISCWLSSSNQQATSNKTVSGNLERAEGSLSTRVVVVVVVVLRVRYTFYYFLSIKHQAYYNAGATKAVHFFTEDVIVSCHRSISLLSYYYFIIICTLSKSTEYNTVCTCRYYEFLLLF